LKSKELALARHTLHYEIRDDGKRNPFVINNFGDKIFINSAIVFGIIDDPYMQCVIGRVDDINIKKQEIAIDISWEFHSHICKLPLKKIDMFELCPEYAKARLFL
jgi:hypothetical protein